MSTKHAIARLEWQIAKEEAAPFPFAGTASLTCMLMPEFMRMTQTCISMGLAHPSWTVPEFFARRTKRHPGAVHGVAHSLGGVVLEVRLQVGRKASLADAHECMLHELAHAMVGPDEDHGPRFRETFRRMVRAHWPDIEPWAEVAKGGDLATYQEDENVIQALERLYLKRRGLCGTSIDQVIMDDLGPVGTCAPETSQTRTAYGGRPYTYVIDFD